MESCYIGWGSWAGLGVAEKKKKQQFEKKMDKDEDNDRMDSHLKYVIINHKRDKKIVKHMVQYYCYNMYNDVLAEINNGII